MYRNSILFLYLALNILFISNHAYCEKDEITIDCNNSCSIELNIRVGTTIINPPTYMKLEEFEKNGKPVLWLDLNDDKSDYYNEEFRTINLNQEIKFTQSNSSYLFTLLSIDKNNSAVTIKISPLNAFSSTNNLKYIVLNWKLLASIAIIVFSIIAIFILKSNHPKWIQISGLILAFSGLLLAALSQA